MNCDVLDGLARIPDGMIDLIVTSPPYYRLRQYGVEGQLGLEPDFREYLSKLHHIMEECKRVLKPTGTCWVNIGDSYAGPASASDPHRGGESGMRETVRTKSRYGIPQRFYANCIDSGWIARNDLIWHKPNAMPASVADRLTNTYEPLYFFSREQRYYFNLDAVRQTPRIKLPGPHADPPHVQQTLVPTDGIQDAQPGRTGRGSNCPELHNRNFLPVREKYARASKSNVARLHKSRPGNPNNKQDRTPGPDGTPKNNYTGFNARWNSTKQNMYGDDDHAGRKSRTRAGLLNTTQPNRAGKNPGDVISIPTMRYEGAHFATFPPALPEFVIRCACPEHVCVSCGEPRMYVRHLADGTPDSETRTEYTRCDCNEPFEPGIVLDPFFGAGTTGLAAELLARRWTGIELNPEYVGIARARLEPYSSRPRMDPYT